MEYFLAEFNFEKRTIDEFSLSECNSLSLPGGLFGWKSSSPFVTIQRLTDWTVFLWGSPQCRTKATTSQELAYEIAVNLVQDNSLQSDLMKLEGFFAVIAWNEKDSQLLFATDPVGMTKVYYGENQGRIVISSHAQHVARRLGDFTVSPQGLSILFSLKGILAPYTVFQAVSVLKPAEILTITGDGRKSDNYWSPLDRITVFKGSLEDAQDELQTLLVNSLQRIPVVSSEPIGVSMSSGVDSALIATLLGKAGISAQALTVGYDPLTRFDETHASTENARRIGLPIEVVRVTDEDISRIINFTTQSLPEPLGDATILPQLLMTLAARGKVSSIINGTGADNIFGGIQSFKAERYAKKYLRLPKFLRVNLIRPALNLLPSSRKSAFTDQVRKMQKFSFGVELPEAEQKVFWSRFMTREAVERIISPTLSPDGHLADQNLLGIRAEVSPAFDDLVTATYAIIRGTLPTYSSQKLVTLQYASGILYHTPFLTPGLIEFALSLPASFKFSEGETKVVLRRAASKILPAEFKSLKKATFSPPISRWLLGVFHTEFLDLLKNNEFFNTAEIENMLAEQSKGWRDWQWELWLVFIYLKWFKETTG